MYGQENVISGVRADCDLFIYVDLKEALKGKLYLKAFLMGILINKMYIIYSIQWNSDLS